LSQILGSAQRSTNNLTTSSRPGLSGGVQRRQHRAVPDSAKGGLPVDFGAVVGEPSEHVIANVAGGLNQGGAAIRIAVDVRAAGQQKVEHPEPAVASGVGERFVEHFLPIVRRLPDGQPVLGR